MSRFAQYSILTQAEKLDAKTRPFTADGSSFIRVPGLLVLAGVALLTPQGRVPLELSETRLHLVNGDERLPRESVEESYFEIQNAGTEDAVVVRSVLSNDGKFQKDATFYITGDWSDGTEKPSAQDTAQEIDGAIKTFESLEAAAAASNEQLNALGIKGPEIVKFRREVEKRKTATPAS